MSSGQPSFKERIYPSLGATLALMALDLSMVFAIWAALDQMFAFFSAIVVLSLSVIWWIAAISKIDLRDGTLYVNDAKIQVAFISDVRSLTEEAWRARRGVDYDPRLFHAHRFWVKSGVELTLDDPRDPHSGWLIGSRKVEELRDAIMKMKARS
jgi:hypothetical protein